MSREERSAAYWKDRVEELRSDQKREFKGVPLRYSASELKETEALVEPKPRRRWWFW